MVAIAEFSAISRENRPADTIPAKAEEDLFPFEMTGTEAVISYVQNKKVRYYRIDGIRQNPSVSYPTGPAKMRQ